MIPDERNPLVRWPARTAGVLTTLLGVTYYVQQAVCLGRSPNVFAIAGVCAYLFLVLFLRGRELRRKGAEKVAAAPSGKEDG